ncbi:alpha-l-rhamnosidase [Ophiostoma piceae UAMH 11346]|uniref:Alpha-l-rhamnosidase n=1 Tax=Ophiostoma piceae (strain UAMH 11346) TaxID=1262450 RepID=S3CES6_OPHP1|nr:alpha-l-rhamnosidase [Ophiostoma piceae UAMH 11346]
MDTHRLGVFSIVALALCCAFQGAQAKASRCWNGTLCDSNFTTSAFPGPWEDGIYAPTSRTVSPESVVQLQPEGTDSQAYRLTRTPYDPIREPLVLAANGSMVILDFGLEVGGLVTLQYSVSGGARPRSALGLAFAESSDYIGQWSDLSNGAFKVQDGALYADLGQGGDNDGINKTYIMPGETLRGGLRYLTVFLAAETSEDKHLPVTVTIHSVSLELSIQPTWPNLRAYQGYFHCDNELFNRIWYAGAYTLQTNAVPTSTGRRVPFVSQGGLDPDGWPAPGWANDGYLGVGDSILVDGAKRDRAVWPGDMGIAAPSIFVSTGDAVSIKNALQTMYDYQNSDGSFPEAGPPLLQQGSDTYHMWTMIGTYTYVLYSGDTDFLQRNWDQYLKAMAFITAKQDSSGLLFVTGTRDWARLNTAGNTTEAQVILYRTLQTGAILAGWMPSTPEIDSLAAAWMSAASALRKATIKYCYDGHRGMFRDSAVSSGNPIYPQDANSMAVVFGLVENSLVAANITFNLQTNWVTLGGNTKAGPYPVSPELPGHISLFISSWELQAQFLTDPDRALVLLSSLWGGYLDRPDGTESTLVEGMYLSANSTSPPSFDYRWNRGYGGTKNDTETAARYTSHSHGWSTGPTSALTELFLGLSITGGVKGAWQLHPRFAEHGPTKVRGGFRGPDGNRYEASWERSQATGSLNLKLYTPVKIGGVVVIPPSSKFRQTSTNIIINGRAIILNDHHFLPNNGGIILHLEGGYYSIEVGRVWP